MQTRVCVPPRHAHSSCELPAPNAFNNNQIF